MARLARVVVPGCPHHVTQRGNRRQPTFFHDSDYQDYLDLLRSFVETFGVDIRCYNLMPNHVHLVVVPERAASLAQAVGWTHCHYTRGINFREPWRGYLWQGRFASCPMDDAHAVAAMRYVELNPVRAHLVDRPEDWPWSSARAHGLGKADPVLSPVPGLPGPKDWRAFLREGVPEETLAILRRATRTGRPCGSVAFVERVERLLGRPLTFRKPGPKEGSHRRKRKSGTTNENQPIMDVT